MKTLAGFIQRTDPFSAVQQFNVKDASIRLAVDDITVILDPETSLILDANDKACTVFGIQRDYLLNTMLNRIEEYLNLTTDQLRKVQIEGMFQTYSTVFTTGSKKRFYDIHAHLVRYNNSDAILVVSTDVTDEIISTRDKGGRGMQKLQSMLSKYSALIWTTDTELRITSATIVDKQFEALSLDSFMGKSVYEVLRTNEFTNPKIASHIQAIQGDKISYLCEIPEGILRINMRPLKDQHSRTIGCFGMAVNNVCTKQKLAEELANYGNHVYSLIHNQITNHGNPDRSLQITPSAAKITNIPSN